MPLFPKFNSFLTRMSKKSPAPIANASANSLCQGVDCPMVLAGKIRKYTAHKHYGMDRDFFSAYVPRTKRFFNKDQHLCKCSTRWREGTVHLSGEDRSNQVFMMLHFQDRTLDPLLFGDKVLTAEPLPQDIVCLTLERNINLFLPLSVSYQLPFSRGKEAGLRNNTIQS